MKLPEPLPAHAQLGYFYGGPIYAIKQKIPGKSLIKLTLDTNANFDLTDDGNLVELEREKQKPTTADLCILLIDRRRPASLRSSRSEILCHCEKQYPVSFLLIVIPPSCHSRESRNLGESRNMKKFYVYILCSKRNGTLYTGVTSDIVMDSRFRGNDKNRE